MTNAAAENVHPFLTIKTQGTIMNCKTHLLSGVLIIFTVITSHVYGAERVIPHTIVFKNTSNVEQTLWIASEYKLSNPDTQPGCDMIRRPLAPNKTFVYGGKRYQFDRLDVRLNPTWSPVFFTLLDS